jgi:hypothetical protein
MLENDERKTGKEKKLAKLTFIERMSGGENPIRAEAGR